MQVIGTLPARVLRLEKGYGAHGVYGGMWHFRRAGKQAGLTVCGIVIDMSGKGYAVWEEADLAVGMWGRLGAGCRGPLRGFATTNFTNDTNERSGGVQLGLFGPDESG